MVGFLKARDGDDRQSTSRCVLLVADQKFAISPRRAAREAALHLVQARSAYLQIASQRSPRNTGLIVDVKPRLRSPMCVGNRGANGGAPLQAARRLPGNSGVLVRPRERMPEAPGRVLQVGARESKGRTLPPQKKRSFRSVSSFAACLTAINDGKTPPRRSWPERTFQCSVFRRYPSGTAWRPCAVARLLTRSEQTGQAERWTWCFRCYWCCSWQLPCEMAEAGGASEKLASEAQRRGRNSVSAVGLTSVPSGAQ